MHETPSPFLELAARLRSAREAQATAADELANRMRVPLHIIRHIEAGEFDRLGAAVYRRGYLSAYARAVGVPLDALDAAFAAEEAPVAQTIASNLIPPRSNVLDRYASAASYLVGTAVVVVSLVWSLQQARVTGARSVPVSSPELSLPAAPQAVRAPGVVLAPIAGSEQTPEPVFSPGPVIASLTPVFMPSSPPPSASSDLTLAFSEETWLEIRRTSDGKRLEYNLMTPGTVKTYPLDGGLKVVIGNVGGVSAKVSSNPFDLAAVTRGNVASFELPLKP